MAVEELARPDVAQFLGWVPVGCLATGGRDGTPQQTWVGFIWDGESFWMNSRIDRVKWRNTERLPRAALSIIDPYDFLRNVNVSGRVELIRGPRGKEVVEQVCVKHQGPEKGMVNANMMNRRWEFGAIRLVPEKAYLMGFTVAETQYEGLKD